MLALSNGRISPFFFNGPETRVTTTTAQSQENSHVTWLKNGNYAVAWESLNQDGSGDGVYARMFNNTGVPVSDEILVNTNTASSQILPKLVSTASGNFVAVWQDGSDIKWQLYDNAGATLGGENIVNTYLPGTQFDFSIDQLLDGGFVVSWESVLQDGSAGGVYAQRFNHLGTKIYTELQLNTTTLNNQAEPDFASLTNGHMVAVWESQQTSTSDRGIFMQMYSNTNTAVGSETLVFDALGPSETRPQVVGLTGGGFAVMYHDATNSQVWVKTYLQTGAAVAGGHKLVSQYGGNNNGLNGTITALSNDRFVATWETGFGVGSEIGYRVMAADGSTIGVGLAHAANITQDQDAEVHELPQGGFIIAFTARDASQTGVFISRFTEDGVAIGDPAQLECQVNTHTPNFQFDSSVSVNSDGDIVVTWTSANQDGSQNGVYTQLLETPVLGTAGADTINGTPDGDLLGGWLGNDTIRGFGGDDRLEGGLGADFLFGGAGADTLFGGVGGDQLFGDAGSDVLDGFSGNDALFGGSGFDTLNAGDGNDTVFGGNGRDLIRLGDGNDRFNDNAQGGELGRDTVFAGGGNDTIEGGAGADEFHGNVGNDMIRARLGSDALFGGDGFDTLNAGDGTDMVYGGNGRDLAFLGNGNDRFFDNGQGGVLGQDTVFGGNGFDTIFGGAGNDIFYGGNGNDRMFGALGNDQIFGGENSDTIFGGDGADTLIGGRGTDQITGGAGLDLFIFHNGFGEDTVFGFSALDGEKLDLSGVSGITDFNDLISNHLEDSGGTARIVVEGNSILLSGVSFADVGASLAYSADDFLF